MELLGPREALERFPMMDADGVLGAVWLPTDGHLDPSGLTYAFIGGAKDRGVTVETGVRVTGLLVEDGRAESRRIAGVVTDHGTVRPRSWSLRAGCTRHRSQPSRA